MTVRLATLALLGCLVSLSAQAQTPLWGDLGGWVGQYPTSRAGGKVTRILDLPAIRTQLRKLLSAADQKLLGSLDVEGPIASQDGFLVIDKCKPHNCPAERAMVVLDTKATRLWVGFFERRAAAVSTRWYGNADDYVALPASILQQFRERHGD
jgi:hypothetical protein